MTQLALDTSVHAGQLPQPDTAEGGNAHRAKGVEKSGERISPLERKKREAMNIARAHYPDADEVRPCLSHGEILVEVWDDHHCELVHTEVYV